MYFNVCEFRQVAFDRVWCRLECNHDVLVRTTNAASLVGMPMDCTICSQVPFECLQIDGVYTLFLTCDPSTPVLMTFKGFRYGLESGYFQVSGRRKLLYMHKSGVAAIEQL